MTSLRHLALGCCVISALAGMLRLFWPENSFKTVINAVLVLYILTAGMQMVRGIDWHGLADELRNLPAGGSTADYEARRGYRRGGQFAGWRLRHHAGGYPRQSGHRVSFGRQRGHAALAVCGGCPMTAREKLAPLAAKLHTALADEKQRVNLLVCTGLAGLVLLGVTAWLPAGNSTQSPQTVQTDTAADYAPQLESRLTALISRVEGAGKTAVMVTLESGSESIYATDTDADGASTHVLLGSGRADGLVETVQTPQVLGVAVVCEGGGNAAVQNRVTALVETLTGVGANHITVAKMASTR